MIYVSVIVYLLIIIGMILQNSLMKCLTKIFNRFCFDSLITVNRYFVVRDSVCTRAAPIAAAERRHCIAEALAFMDLEGVADALVRTYSGAMIRRLEIYRIGEATSPTAGGSARPCTALGARAPRTMCTSCFVPGPPAKQTRGDSVSTLSIFN